MILVGFCVQPETQEDGPNGMLGSKEREHVDATHR